MVTDPGIQYSPCPTATYFDIFAEIEKYTVTIDKHEAVAYLTQFDIPWRTGFKYERNFT